MTLIGLEPDGVRALSGAMRNSAVAADDLAAEVDVALKLAELESDIVRAVTVESIELEKVSLILEARADLAEGFVIDVDVLAKRLGLLSSDVEAALNAVSSAPEGSDPGDPLLTLVAEKHYLFDDLPESLRDVFIGLPPAGEDAELDAALTRLDGTLLELIQTGESIELDNLTDQQNADLKVLAEALGGDKITVTRKEREKYRGGRGDDEYRNVTKQIPITELGLGYVFEFVEYRLNQDAGRRRAANELVRATANIDRSDLPGAAAELGITVEELKVTLASADLLAATVEGRVPSGGLTGTDLALPERADFADGEDGDRDYVQAVEQSRLDAATGADDPSFPDRADFPEGKKGDDAYIDAVEQNRLDAVNRGDNVVGPVGSEQDAFYEAMGSLFGSQNFAFSHDYQATQAEIENLNNPGFLGVDIPNAVTATVGYAAAVVTAPAIAAINSVFGTEIDVGAVGVAIADFTWSAFGYDVEAPTVSESQSDRDLKDRIDEISEEAREKQRREGGDNNGDGRVNSYDSDYDNDGESDATDNTDDSGDPSGGHDGGV